MTAASPLKSDSVSTWKDSVDELCIALAIPKDDLLDLLNHLPNYYYIKPHVSDTGKHRTFYSARGRLLAIQIKLKKWLSRLPVHPAAYGWREGHNHIMAVAAHVGKPCVISLDIADFFPTITPRRIRNLYQRLGCSAEIADILTRLTTYKGHLAQGLKTSPALANLVMVEIDERIDTACRHLDFTYRRVCDDITLSGGKGAQHIESLVKSILKQTGFHVKEEKTERNQRHTRQTALKLIVNTQPNLPREKRQRLRAIANNCLKEGIDSERQEDEDSHKAEARIRGQLSYWAQVNPKAAQSSLRKFKQAIAKSKHQRDEENIAGNESAEESTLRPPYPV